MIPFSPPRIDQAIIDEVTAALQSGWITTGPRTKQFEKELSAFGGQPATLCVNSASAGLELMLRWYGVKPGDEVILPAYTYAATANVIMHCGARPVFVDSQTDFNISTAAVQRAITPRTKVIMPVDIAGLPCDYDKLNQLVNDPIIKKQFVPATPEQEKLGRILILSDAAHSIGAHYLQKRAGAFTDLSVYSFHAVKNLTTAEGGAICLNLPAPFNNQEIYRQLNIKSLHGQSKDALAKSKIGQWRYDIVEPGYKCNMTDIQAAMGLVELRRYETDMLKRRKAIFDHYSAGFAPYDWADLPITKTTEKESSYHVYQLRIRQCDESRRDRIIQKIFDQEVAVNVHFVPLPLMSYYKNQGHQMNHFPVAYKNFSCEISLPVYYDLSSQQIDTVIAAVTKAVTETPC